jgi:hypothetical protein
MKISAEGRSVFSELFVEISAFLLLSIPGYIIDQDWPRLTLTILLCILTIRAAIDARKKLYARSQ